MVYNTPILSGVSPSQNHVYAHGHQISTVWALILNKREARFFEKEGRHFNAVKEMENLQLVYDGLSNDTIGRESAMGVGRHKLEPSMTESRQNTIAFAKEIINWLEKQRVEGHFDEFVIAASPAMLGEILKDVKGPLRKCLVGQSDKNLMEFNGRDLEQELLKIIPGPEKE